MLLVGCAVNSDSKLKKSETLPHVLEGMILDVRSGTFIDQTELYSQILKYEYILLGETHDNIDHHHLQAYVIDRISDRQDSTSVSFEMITRQQGEFIRQHHYDSSAKLIELLNKEKNYWRYKRYYKIVFDSAIRAGSEILPANLNLEKLMQITMHSESNIPADIRTILEQVPFTNEQYASLQREIVRSHCNMIPLEATGPMVRAQQIRDVVMSLSMVNSNAAAKILIAGAGHTRTDRGVPLYLGNFVDKTKIVSLAFLEVNPEAKDLTAYYQRWGSDGLPFDYVWFTPAVQRQIDPCDQFKRRHKEKQASL